MLMVLFGTANEMPTVVRATCPTHGVRVFVSATALNSTDDWWACEEWVWNTPEYMIPTCFSAIFREDMTPDGVEVRDFEQVVLGILGNSWNLRVMMDWSHEEAAVRSRRMTEAWDGTRKR